MMLSLELIKDTGFISLILLFSCVALYGLSLIMQKYSIFKNLHKVITILSLILALFFICGYILTMLSIILYPGLYITNIIKEFLIQKYSATSSYMSMISVNIISYICGLFLYLWIIYRLVIAVVSNINAPTTIE